MAESPNVSELFLQFWQCSGLKIKFTDYLIIGAIRPEFRAFVEAKRKGEEHYRDKMVEVATRFYLKALDDAGIKVSEHITKQCPTTRKKGTNGAKKTKGRAARAPKGRAPAQELDHGAVVPPEFERLPIPGMDGAFIQYPKNLTEANCDLFEAMIGALRTYAKSRKGSEGRKT